MNAYKITSIYTNTFITVEVWPFIYNWIANYKRLLITAEPEAHANQLMNSLYFRNYSWYFIVCAINWYRVVYLVCKSTNGA